MSERAALVVRQRSGKWVVQREWDDGHLVALGTFVAKFRAIAHANALADDDESIEIVD